MQPFKSLVMFSILIELLQLASAGPQCKAIPGTSSWPSLSQWASLNGSVDGRLIQATPLASVCHSGWPLYDSAQCASVTQGWTEIDFHAQYALGYPWNNFENDSCLPDPTAPCTGNGYPVYYVNATSKEEVKKAVDFARDHKVRLIVKGSGHDYIGRSSAPNSLSIWTRYLQGIKFHDAFKPKGCRFSIDGPAVTIAAGMNCGEVNLAASLRNLTVLTTGEESVGYGGFITGGGHAALAPAYGLLADVVLEMELITPKGDSVTINECQNQDLFWAMRGGGGSTFGVMTSVTVKAFPSVPVVSMTIQVGTLAGSESFWDAMTYLFSQYPYLSTLGISGYNNFSPNATYAGAFYAGVVGVFLMPILSPSNTSESLSAAINSVLFNIATKWPEFENLGSTVTTHTQFYDWWSQNTGPKYAGVEQVIGSRLLDKKALTKDPAAVKKALKAFAGVGCTVMFVGGGKVNTGLPRGGSDSVNPAWRRTIVHVSNGVTWAPFDFAAKAKQTDLLTNTYVAALRELAPDMGAYVNEADVNEPDWQNAFWGINYARLREIKRRVDPEDVFWCHPCVGNEGWKEDENGVLCRV